MQRDGFPFTVLQINNLFINDFLTIKKIKLMKNRKAFHETYLKR